MQRHFLILASVMGMVAGATSNLRAAEVVIHDSEAYEPAWVYRHGEYRPAPRDRLTGRVEGPAVYGWSYRPANCGVFHYWNGDECVDARSAPPAQ